MKHYSEHILDLYARNSPQVAGEREEIEQHVIECEGCRAVVEDLQGFYAAAGSTPKQLVSADEENDALTVQPSYVRSRLPIFVQWKDILPVRIWNAVRRRPAVASISMLAMAVIMIFSVKQFMTAEDANPVEFNYASSSKQVILYNRSGHNLWSLGVKDLGASEEITLMHRRAKYDLLLDIDLDGKNEFLTTRFVVGHTSGEIRTLNIFNYDGSFRESRTLLPKGIRFRTHVYDRQFEPVFLLFDSTSQSLFIAASNLRSPWVLQRYDRSFELLGEYWHYGGMQFGQVDIDNDGRTEIALYGKNDVEDATSGDFAFLTVIDPLKVTEKCEDPTTQGFGFPSSSAGILSMRFPVPDVNKAMKNNPSAQHILNETSEGFDIFVAAELEPGKPHVGLEYHFSKPSQRITAVRWNTGFEAFYQRMQQEGRVSSELNGLFLMELVDSVEYWIGKVWVYKK
jgi:hypothetical protein